MLLYLVKNNDDIYIRVSAAIKLDDQSIAQATYDEYIEYIESTGGTVGMELINKVTDKDKQNRLLRAYKNQSLASQQKSAEGFARTQSSCRHPTMTNGRCTVCGWGGGSRDI